MFLSKKEIKHVIQEKFAFFVEIGDQEKVGIPWELVTLCFTGDQIIIDNVVITTLYGKDTLYGQQCHHNYLFKVVAGEDEENAYFVNVVSMWNFPRRTGAEGAMIYRWDHSSTYYTYDASTNKEIQCIDF